MSTATTAGSSGTERLTKTAVIDPSMTPSPPGTSDTSDRRIPTPKPITTSPGAIG